MKTKARILNLHKSTAIRIIGKDKGVMLTETCRYSNYKLFSKGLLDDNKK